MTFRSVLVTLACVTSVMTSSTQKRNNIATILNNLKRAEAGYCDEIAPGAAYMFKGVDLTTLDFFNRRSFKQPVLAMTCHKGNTKKWNTQMCADSNADVFNVPDQIEAISFDNSGSMDTDTSVIESMSDLTNSFSANVEVSGSYGPVSGSASLSYSKMSRDIAENKYFYSVVEAKESTTTYTNYYNAELSSSANGSLPWGTPYDRNNARSRGLYRTYIQKFGTHCFDIGYYGGNIRMVVKTESALLKKYSKTQLKAAASVKYSGLIASASMSASMSKEQESANEQFNSASSESVKYYGGYTDLISKESGLTDWQPSVRANPYMLGGMLSPTYERIKDDVMRENMRHAVQDYLKVTYYKSLKQAIDRFVKSYKHSDKENILRDLIAFKETLEIGSSDDEFRTVGDVKYEYDGLMEDIGKIAVCDGGCGTGVCVKDEALGFNGISHCECPFNTLGKHCEKSENCPEVLKGKVTTQQCVGACDAVADTYTCIKGLDSDIVSAASFRVETWQACRDKCNSVEGKEIKSISYKYGSSYSSKFCACHSEVSEAPLTSSVYQMCVRDCQSLE